MSQSKVPDKYSMANIRKHIFRSRPMFLFIFSIFLLVGIWGANQSVASYQNIGASLIASAIVAFATVWIDLIRGGEQLRADELARAGLQQVFDRRNLEEYDDLVKKAAKISVTGYTLRAFTEANEPILRERARNSDNFSVRMLLVDPDSEIAATMEAAEKQSRGAYKTSLLTIKQQMAGLDQRVEIRLLKKALPSMIYMLDDILYTGPYPHQGSSRHAFTFKLESNGWLFKRQRDEFESLWNSAEKTPLTSP